MITLTEKQKILSRHIQGVSNREIARELHISKNTVNKYVAEYDDLHRALMESNPETDEEEIISAFTEKPKYDSSGRSRRKVTPEIIALVNECLEENEAKLARGKRKQIMKKTDIWEYVREKGYDISRQTISNIIDESSEKHFEAYIKQQYEPGDTSEFDWGEVELHIGGKAKKYQMAVFTAPYSNERFAKLYERQDTAAFLEAHADYFYQCGGVFHNMVYDNMRIAVKRFVGINEKEPTEALLSLSVYYGFRFRFCNIASGNEKGDVERSVEYVRRKAFSRPGADRFETLEEANKHLMEECKRLNTGMNEDGTSIETLFSEERKHLLPPMRRYNCFGTQHAKVDKYSTFAFQRNHYSVPDTLVGKTVDLRIYTDKLLVYYDGSVVAQHKRSYHTNEWHIDIYHYLRTLNKKPGALSQSTALLQADTRVKNIYEKYYTDNVREFLQVIEIIREKGIEAVELAIQALEILSPADYSADKIKSICESRSGLNETKPGKDTISSIAGTALPLYDALLKAVSQRRAV